MIFHIKLFPKVWLDDLYKAINQNDNKCAILNEVHKDGDYCTLDIEAPDEFNLIMLGVWIGHNSAAEAVKKAQPEVIENIKKLIESSTQTSEN